MILWIPNGIESILKENEDIKLQENTFSEKILLILDHIKF